MLSDPIFLPLYGHPTSPLRLMREVGGGNDILTESQEQGFADFFGIIRYQAADVS